MKDRHFKTNAPFGIATKRFAKLGFHPELDVSGAMKKEITKTGPGSYNIKYQKCKSKQGFRWKVKVETEEFSKFLGYRNADILHEREFYKTLRGPGTSELNEDFYKRKQCSILENIGFGTGERFRYTEKKDPGPPPNTYFRNIEETSTLPKPKFSKVPTIEWDGFVDRFRSTKPVTQAPNRYNPNDGKGIDSVLNKVVSLRGPYELFTGPRDGSTIKNYFSPPALKVPEYFYVKPSDVDVLLHHPSKDKYGLFLKSKRFTKKPTVRSMLNDLSLCYRDPNDPGPSHYDLENTNCIQAKTESMYPFGTSKANVRPLTDWRISPGPGRYTPKTPKCMKLKKPSYVFLSKTKRKFFNAVEYDVF